MTDAPTRWEKDPGDILDFEADWAADDEDWLDGDTISASAWTVPDGITKDSDTHTSTTTTIWLSGGTAGSSYKLTNQITTAGGRTANKSRYILVRNE